jgi:hypothetical protein
MRSDEHYNKTVKPISVNGVTGVEIISGSGIDRIYFNPYGSTFEVNSVVSDGEKVVIRESNNAVVSWALVRGTKLIHKENKLLNNKCVTNKAS